MKEDTSWSEQRKNLLRIAQKYPGALIDVIDSAYLVGLEAGAKMRSAGGRSVLLHAHNVVKVGATPTLRNMIKGSQTDMTV